MATGRINLEPLITKGAQRIVQRIKKIADAKRMMRGELQRLETLQKQIEKESCKVGIENPTF